MAMSDCARCWDTPCTCGWDYRSASLDYLFKQIQLLQKVISFRVNNPAAKFSSFSEPKNESDLEFLAYMFGSTPEQIRKEEAYTEKVRAEYFKAMEEDLK